MSTTGTHDYTRSEDARGVPIRCDRCEHSQASTEWPAPLQVCTERRVLRAHRVPTEESHHGIACNVARSMMGHCGPSAIRFKAKR